MTQALLERLRVHLAICDIRGMAATAGVMDDAIDTIEALTCGRPDVKKKKIEPFEPTKKKKGDLILTSAGFVTVDGPHMTDEAYLLKGARNAEPE